MAVSDDCLNVEHFAFLIAVFLSQSHLLRLISLEYR